MARADLHPLPQDLTRFLTGQLPEAEMEPLAVHLADCSICQQALPEQLPEDSLLAALRRPLDPEPCALEPECARTIDQLAADAPSSLMIAAAGETAAFRQLPSEATPEQAPSSGARAATPPALDRLPCDFGRYHVVRRLGRGGMGAVYLAEDRVLARQVALKISRFRDDGPDEEARFRREARAAAALQHEGICPVFDFGIEGGIPFITMAYVEGQSLHQLLKDQGKLEPRRAAELIRQAALALGEAHRRGVLHRDLKPANILIDQQGRSKVVDFGLARRADDVTLTQPGAAAGTPAYMSPEQVRCEQLTGATDLYSLGAILYQLLTGQLPYPGSSLTELSYQIVHTEPPPPSARCPDLDPRLDAICRRAMAKAVADRHATGDELAVELEAIVGGRTPEPAAARPQARRWGHVVALAACLALLATGLYFLVRGRDDIDAYNPENASNPEMRPGPDAGPQDRLEGEINILVYEENNPDRQNVSLDQKMALPLKAGDWVRVEAFLNRPAFAYLVWIDSMGKVAPVYPWRPGHWEDSPLKEEKVTRLQLPGMDKYWPIKAMPPGMETFLLLARDTPLEANVKLETLLADLGKQPAIDPRSVVWFENFSMINKKGGLRGPDFDNPKEIVDEVYRVQSNLEARLGKHFSYSIAASFANLGK
jgi:predicted Ser/Thr protein kinase